MQMIFPHFFGFFPANPISSLRSHHQKSESGNKSGAPHVPKEKIGTTILRRSDIVPDFPTLTPLLPSFSRGPSFSALHPILPNFPTVAPGTRQ
jgi:hypothetical protein